MREPWREAADSHLPAWLDGALTAACQEGWEAKGTTSPNPPVGAVIVGDDGAIIGRGHTQPVGGPHAEVMALREAGEFARGATAVVTLEPCSHTGRTGPCTQALIDAGIRQVFFVHRDPHPVAGGGAQVLQAAGIGAEQIAPERMRAIYAGIPDAVQPWLQALRLQRPHVTLKWAQTLDGFTAAVDGTSQWITSEVAREYVHADRARRDAIIVGTGTALADKPRLTARYADGAEWVQQPRRVVIGKRNVLPVLGAGFEQYGTIAAALEQLWETGARDVLVEGGATLAGAFLAGGYVDAIQAYIAPVLLGGGRGIVQNPLAQTLSQGLRYTRKAVHHLGPDVLIELVREFPSAPGSVEHHPRD